MRKKFTVVTLVLVGYGCADPTVAGLERLKVPGGGMEPTIAPGEQVYVEQLHGSDGLERSDVVVYESPGEPNRRSVKRIVAVPGDVVQIAGDIFSVNEGSSPLDRRTATVARRIVLQPGEYFLVGDNRGASLDSRDHGPVLRAAILERVVLVEGTSGERRPIK